MQAVETEAGAMSFRDDTFSMDALTLSSLGLGIIGVALAVWQSRNARYSDRSRESAERELKETIERVPAQVAEALGQILQAEPNSDNQDTSQAFPKVLGYEDVNRDGRKELLVWYPTGAHASNLAVYGWQPLHGLIEIGNIFSNTPVLPIIRDFDGDGFPEIQTMESQWYRLGTPYAQAPVEPELHRWDGHKFVEVPPTNRERTMPETDKY